LDVFGLNLLIARDKIGSGNHIFYIPINIIFQNVMFLFPACEKAAFAKAKV
jgi:hypothetical protein